MSGPQTNEYPARGYASHAPDRPLEPFASNRRSLRPDAVLIEISHCAICHWDLHMARNSFTLFPPIS